MHVYAALGYASTTRFPDDEVPPSTRIARSLALRVKDGDAAACEAVARWLLAAHPGLAFQLAGALLVPLPSSKTTPPPTALAAALASRIPRTEVRRLVTRAVAVPSSRLLRRTGRSGLSVDEHLATMSVTREPDARRVVLVDDVFTTGATATAAARLLGLRNATLIVAAGAVDVPAGAEHRSRQLRVDDGVAFARAAAEASDTRSEATP